MFEKEIKFIVDFTLNKIRKSGTFFTLDKLLSAGVHPAIVKYISAELELLIYEDRQKLLNHSTFDYSGSEIARHFGMISKEIKRNKRIAFDDIKKLVIQAVSFNVNHAVRPRWSLTKLIFDPSPSRSVEEIRLLLEYTYFYDYIKNILSGYLDKKKVNSLTQNEFEQVYEKIDNELFTPGSRKLVDGALSSISDFFNEGAAVKEKIAPELFLVFLKEKNLNEYSGRLRNSMSPEGKQKYKLNEISSIIYGSEMPKSPEPLKAELPAEKKSMPEELDIIEDVEEAVIDDIEFEDEEFVRVSSAVPPQQDKELLDEFIEDKDIEEEKVQDKAAEDILLKSETEIAEEINLPIVEDNVKEMPEEVKDEEFEIEPETSEEDEEEEFEIEIDPDEPGVTEAAEIDLNKETKFILPDDEIKQLSEDEPVKEKTADEIESDEDEVKFDLEERDKLDDLYEFEEDKAEETSHVNEHAVIPDIDSQDFNLSELENELKQIEEEFNIQPEYVKVSKEIKNTSGDIFRFLSDKEVERIIGNIFNDDRDDFTNTLERISECDNYDKATEILKGVFLTYRINPYSRDAVSLTNAVSKYFDMK